MALINTLNGIGDAIREKTGGTELIPLKDMPNAIASISGKPTIKDYMEYDTAGTDFVKFSYYSAGTKTIVASKINDGKSVVAGVYNNNMLTIYCIALDPQTADCATLTGGSTTTFSYKGHAHYIGWRGVFNSSTSPASRESYVWTNQCETFELSDIGATSTSDFETIGTYILDYYYTSEYDSAFADGVASVPNPLEYAMSCVQLLYGATFPENYELTLNVPRATNFTTMTQNATNLVKLIIKGNIDGNKVVLSSAFRCSTLVVLDLSEFNAIADSDGRNICSGAKALKEVKGTFDFTNVTQCGGAFSNCVALEEIRFKELSIFVSIGFPQSSKLSAESVQSIIDGLATVETAQTLTLNSAIVLTDEQKSTIESKGWTLVQ